MDIGKQLRQVTPEFETEREIRQHIENNRLSAENEDLKLSKAGWKLFFTMSFVVNCVFVADWLIDSGVII